MTNSNKLFLKFPENLKSDINRASGTVGIAAFKDYYRYLWFKSKNRFGFVSAETMKANKNTNRYWMRKLVSRGWASPCKGGYSLKSYQYVWTTLKTEKVTKTKSKRYSFKYQKFIFKSESPKEFFNYCRNYIEHHLVQRKKYQIIHRLLTGKYGVNPKAKSLVKTISKTIKTIEKPVMGSKSAGSLLGYKSPTSGVTVLKKRIGVCEYNLPEVYWYRDCKGNVRRRLTPYRINLC